MNYISIAKDNQAKDAFQFCKRIKIILVERRLELYEISLTNDNAHRIEEIALSQQGDCKSSSKEAYNRRQLLPFNSYTIVFVK